MSEMASVEFALHTPYLLTLCHLNIDLTHFLVIQFTLDSGHCSHDHASLTLVMLRLHLLERCYNIRITGGGGGGGSGWDGERREGGEEEREEEGEEEEE